MVSVTTWTSPEIDARIVALKQTGLSHAQIAVAVCHEFNTFVTKNMILRRSRTILGLDRGEKAANARLARRRKAEEAEKAPPPPVPVPPPPVTPVVTPPPLASVAGPMGGYGPLAFNYQSLSPPRPATPLAALPAPLGNGKCTYPLWSNGVAPTHRYCQEPTPLGTSWCRSHFSIVYTRAQGRAA